MSNNYLRRRTITVGVTIPSSNQTETFSINGSTAVAPSVVWASSSDSIGYNQTSATYSLYSTDPDGENPSVSHSGVMIASSSLNSYSNGVGSVGVSFNANQDSNSRTGTLTAQSSVDSATATLTITQAAAPVVVASTGSLPADTTWAYNPDSSDTYDITVTTNGRWDASASNLPSGWSISKIGRNSPNGTIRVNKPSGNTFTVQTVVITLTPSNSNTALDTMNLDIEPEA